MKWKENNMTLQAFANVQANVLQEGVPNLRFLDLITCVHTSTKQKQGLL
jgi:hypothetical protein